VFHEALRTLLVLLAPFTPHLSAELWERLGLTPEVGRVPWPRTDPRAVRAATKRIVVKVDARTVTQLEVAAHATREEVLALAYGHEAVRACLGSGRASREIYVEDRMLNLVS